MINCDVELEVETPQPLAESHDPGEKELEFQAPETEALDADLLENELNDNFIPTTDFAKVQVTAERKDNPTHKQLSGIKNELLAEKSMKRSKKVDINDFKINSVIGKGGYGKVMLVSKISGDDYGQTYAMKTISKAKLLKSKTDTQHTRSERKILEAISHPFIVQLKYAFQNAGKLYLVMAKFQKTLTFFK